MIGKRTDRKGILLTARYGLLLCVILLISVFPLSAHAHRNHDSDDPEKQDMGAGDGNRAPGPGRAETPPREIGVNERLGAQIPMDTAFVDELGDSLILRDFIDRPTLILPVFFHCPQSCSLLLANLADALNGVPYPPGDTYRVLALSFDADETPKDAVQAKKNYLERLRKDFPETGWRFLTGSSESILSLTGAMGFRFRQQDIHQFTHPNVLICVAEDGKIIRYLYGPDFLPFDINMALAEAEKGTPGLSIKKMVSYCFAYDPENKKYVFKTFRVSGFIILGFLTIFLFFLLRGKKGGVK